MMPLTHEVHFLTLAVVGTRRGWVAPVELPQGSQQAAAHVVPVGPGGDLFPRYRIEFTRCSAGGGYTADSSTLDLQPAGRLDARIDGRVVHFQLRLEQGRPAVLPYVGSLAHPDFSFPLAEIVPEDESQLEDLYEQQGIVIVGCDPSQNYGGMDVILRTIPPQAG